MPVLTSRYNVTIDDGRGDHRSLPSAEALQHRGPVVAATLLLLDAHRQAMVERGEDIPERVSGIALVDTGASCTCIDEAAARQAGLAVVDQGTISTASHATHDVPIFAGQLDIPDFGRLKVTRAMGATLANQGLIALIGRDALRGTIFIYNGIDGSISLAR